MYYYCSAFTSRPKILWTLNHSFEEFLQSCEKKHVSVCLCWLLKELSHVNKYVTFANTDFWDLLLRHLNQYVTFALFTCSFIYLVKLISMWFMSRLSIYLPEVCWSISSVWKEHNGGWWECHSGTVQDLVPHEVLLPGSWFQLWDFNLLLSSRDQQRLAYGQRWGQSLSENSLSSLVTDFIHY